MLAFLSRFAKDESGATAIEYGLICACIFVVAVGAITAFGNKATGIFNAATTAIIGAG